MDKNSCRLIAIEVGPLHHPNPLASRYDEMNTRLSTFSQLKPELSSLALHDTGRTPWLHRNVVIIWGPYRGRRANVVDVLINQSTPSGIRIRVSLYGKGATEIVVEYDEIEDEK